MRDKEEYQHPGLRDRCGGTTTALLDERVCWIALDSCIKRNKVQAVPRRHATLVRGLIGLIFLESTGYLLVRDSMRLVFIRGLSGPQGFNARSADLRLLGQKAIRAPS